MTTGSHDSVKSEQTSIHSAMANRKELHDLLLAQMPEGASHEPCSLCQSPIEDGMPEGGTRVSNTYTEEDLQTAVAEATAPLAARIQELESAAQVSEIDAAVSAAKAETAAEIEDLRSKLDNAVLAAQAATSELETFKAELTELADAETAAAEAEARKEERLARVKEVASFPDEHLAENADRYAAMSEEDFEARLAEWAALAPVKGTAGDSIPKTTALTAAREDTNTSSGMAEIAAVMRGNLVGQDLRTL